MFQKAYPHLLRIFVGGVLGLFLSYFGIHLLK